MPRRNRIKLSNASLVQPITPGVTNNFLTLQDVNAQLAGNKWPVSPAAPTNFNVSAYDNALLLKWQPPEQTAGINNYVVRYFRAGQPVKTQTVAADATRFVIDELQNNETYTVQIAAVGVRQGRSSPAVSAVPGRRQGALYAFGNNYAGTFGNGQKGVNFFHTTPQQIGARTDWVDIAGGYSTALGITASGEMYLWGTNYGTDLGAQGSYGFVPTPTRVGSQNNWQKAWIIGSTYFAANHDGELFRWGDNWRGKLGNGFESLAFSYPGPKMLVPTRFEELPGRCIDLASALPHTIGVIALLDTGAMWGWGPLCNGVGSTPNLPALRWGDAAPCLYNANGSPYGEPSFKPQPLFQNTSSVWKKITNSGGIAVDGTFWSWGWGANGVCGDGGDSTAWRTTAAPRLNGAKFKNAIKGHSQLCLQPVAGQWQVLGENAMWGPFPGPHGNTIISPLGLSTISRHELQPVTLPTTTKFISVTPVNPNGAGGGGYGIGDDEKVYVWGYPKYMFFDEPDIDATPTELPALNGAIKIVDAGSSGYAIMPA